jgi:hypothetical protein
VQGSSIPALKSPDGFGKKLKKAFALYRGDCKAALGAFKAQACSLTPGNKEYGNPALSQAVLADAVKPLPLL